MFHFKFQLTKHIPKAAHGDLQEEKGTFSEGNKKQKASSLCRKCFAGILCVKWVERVEEAKHQTWMNIESWGSVTETDFMRG